MRLVLSITHYHYQRTGNETRFNCHFLNAIKKFTFYTKEQLQAARIHKLLQ